MKVVDDVMEIVINFSNNFKHLFLKRTQYYNAETIGSSQI